MNCEHKEEPTKKVYPFISRPARLLDIRKESINLGGTPSNGKDLRAARISGDLGRGNPFSRELNRTSLLNHSQQACSNLGRCHI